MEKYQPNKEITLKCLKDNPTYRYVLPSNFSGLYPHPKYKIFNMHPSVVPFVCQNMKCEYLCAENDNMHLLAAILSIKRFAQEMPEYTFFIENFSKLGLNCCCKDWKPISNKIESELKNIDNIIFLWDNPNTQ